MTELLQRVLTWSVRVSVKYRALAFREDGEVVWFWIGPHAEYDRMIAQR